MQIDPQKTFTALGDKAFVSLTTFRRTDCCTQAKAPRDPPHHLVRILKGQTIDGKRETKRKLRAMGKLR